MGRETECQVKELSEQTSWLEKLEDNKPKVVDISTKHDLMVDSLIAPKVNKDTTINEEKVQRITSERITTTLHGNVHTQAEIDNYPRDIEIRRCINNKEYIRTN